MLALRSRKHNHDSDTFRRHLGDVPVSGFFCNGEIGPVEGRTFLRLHQLLRDLSAAGLSSKERAL